MQDQELPTLGQPSSQDNTATNTPVSASVNQAAINDTSKSIAHEVSQGSTEQVAVKEENPSIGVKISPLDQIVVSGFIKQNDKPIPGAVITVKDENNIPAHTLISDQDGFFKTELLYANNKYIIEVTSPNLSFKPTPINLDSETVKNLIIQSS